MNLNGFVLWDKEPNTVDKRGKLYHQDLKFNTNNEFKNRKYRI